MARKVLFLCAHNQSRSVTAEGLLTGESGFEVRSRALWHGTPRKVTAKDGRWADEVYVMMPGMKPVAVEAGVPAQKIRTLWVPDNYIACEPELMRELRKQLEPFDIKPRKSLAQAQSDCYKVLDRKMGWGREGFLWEWGEMTPPEASKEPPIKEPEYLTRSGRYVPLWHMEEAERIRGGEEPVPREQMLAEFEEAEAYVKGREQKRETMKEKERREGSMLRALEKYTKSIQKLFE